MELGRNDDLDRQLDLVATRLADEFDGRIDPADVRRSVEDARRTFGDPPVTQYLPVLVARQVRSQLRPDSAA